MKCCPNAQPINQLQCHFRLIILSKCPDQRYTFLLICNTDHLTVIRNLGQLVSSGQTNQHHYLFLNYNAKHTGSYGNVGFSSEMFLGCLFPLLLEHHMNCRNRSTIYKNFMEILQNPMQFLHVLRWKLHIKCFFLFVPGLHIMWNQLLIYQQTNWAQLLKRR